MNAKYDPDDMLQVYFKALQYACTILVSLQETVADKVLICQAIYQFNKHMDLNEAVENIKNHVSENMEEIQNALQQGSNEEPKTQRHPKWYWNFQSSQGSSGNQPR